MSWWLAARRRAGDAPAFPAALAVVLALTATVLASAGWGGGAVLAAGIRQTLTSAPSSARGVEVAVRHDPVSAARQDALVRARLGGALAGTRPRVYPSFRGELLPLPGLGAARLVPLAAPDLAAHATLTGGRWPVHGGRATGPIEATLQVDAARLLQVTPGTTLHPARTDAASAAPPPVLVVGLWRASDPRDPFWLGSPIELTGVERDGVLGPLALDPAALAALPVRWQARWRASPDPASVRPQDVARLSGAIAGLPGSLADVPTAGGAPAAVTAGDLGALLTSQLAPQRRASAAVTVLVAVLALLAAGLALLAATVLAQARGEELTLLRTRGADAPARLGLELREGLAVAAPAAVPAAAATALAVRALAGSPQGAGWSAAAPAATGAAGLAGLVAVAVASATVQASRHRRRAAAVGADRSGGIGGAAPGALPAALAAAAGLAGWQLAGVRTAGTPAGTDPVLVVAACALLTCTAMLAVSALAALGRPAAALARGTGLLAAMLGWHTARRGTRPAAPLAVLILAVAAGSCTAVAMASADDRTREQAAGLQAADLAASLVVPPGTPADAGIAAAVQVAPALARLAGVRSVTAVTAVPGRAGGRPARLLAVDAAALAGVTQGAGAFAVPASSAAALAAGPDRPRGLTLPASDRSGRGGQDGRRLLARFTLTVQGSDGAPMQPELETGVTAHLAGPDGVPLAVPLQPTPTPASVGRGGAAGRPGAPIDQQLSGSVPASADTLIGLDVTVRAMPWSVHVPGGLVLQISQLAIRPGSGSPLALTGPSPAWATRAAQGQEGGPTPAVEVSALPAGGFRAAVGSPNGYLPGVSLRLAPALAGSAPPAGSAPEPLPVLLPAGLAGTLGVAPGDALAFEDGSGARFTMRVADVLAGTPTAPEPADGTATASTSAPSTTPVLLADARALAGLDWDADRPVHSPRQWWIHGDADPAAVATTLAPARLSDPGAERVGPPRVTSRSALRETLLADPVVVGMHRLQLLAVAGMVAVALVALAFGEVIGARQRRGELAVLRALGATRSDLSRLLAAEQTAVAGAAILLGAAAGVALSPLLAPVLGGSGIAEDTGGQTAGAVAGGTPAGVVVPVGGILAGVGLLLLAAAVGALVRGRLAARADVAAVLRGEVR